MEELDQLIFDEVKKLEFAPVTPVKVKPKSKKPVLTQIEKIDSQIDRLLDVYALGNIPIDAFNKKITQLNEQKAALEESLKPEPVKMTQAEAVKIAKSFDDILERGNFDEIRSVLMALIDKIVLTDDDIKIFWSFS